MKWIDPKDLSEWADLPESRVELPQLVRRLVLNTTARPSSVDIPGGSSVNSPGWDGIIESDGGSVVPGGKVVFEMSTSSDVAGMAKANYEKRTKGPLRVVPSAATFVFVTPRVWSAKEAWVRERIKDGTWKDVQVFDASTLAQWIDASPADGSRFARQIGKTPPAGFIALSDHWKEWSSATNPPATPSLLQGGRDEQVAKLSTWATAAPATFFVQGEKKDDAIAFVAAWASVHGDAGGRVLDRGLVVTDRDAWLDLSRRKSPLVLIPSFDGEFSATVAMSNGHHVLTPLDKGQRLSGAGCVLPRQGREAFISALKEMGIADREAAALAASTGRHLPTLRRRLIDHAGGPKPDWVSAPNARDLLPALLLGEWTEGAGDVGALGVLASRVGADVLSHYQRYLAQPDSPLRKIGHHWRLTSHEEAWELLSPLLSKIDVERFTGLATETLSELSPALELEPDERYMAGIKGAVLARSATLREGIAATLALMACRAAVDGAEPTIAPVIAVRDILNKRGSDWRFWATASAELSTLMEAAPAEMLGAIEEQVAVTPSPFLELFEQEGDGMFGACYHSGLLWALERAAMSSDHFSRASLALARLAAIDPGGKYSNRPLESLRGLFLGWIHHSDVSDAERLKVLDLICARIPDIGWKLLMAVSPGGHDGVSGREPAMYRAWGQDMSKGPTRREYFEFEGQVVRRVIANVGSDPIRWRSALDHLWSLSDDDEFALVSLLEAATGTLKDVEPWQGVRARLRDILHRCRTYPDTERSVSALTIDRLDGIYNALMPRDLVAANAWLFGDWPDLPEGGRITDKEMSTRIEELQKEAFSGIHSQSGPAGISRLIETSPSAGRAGAIAGRFFGVDPNIRALIVGNLSSDRLPEQAFAHQATAAIYEARGWNGLDPLLNEARAHGVSPSGLGVFYLAPTANKETWDRLALEADPVRQSYWTRLSGWILNRVEPAEYEYGVSKLLDYGRAPDVLDAMAYGRENIPPALMIRALELAPGDIAVAAAAGTGIRVSSSDIAQVFAKLEKASVDPKVIARLEVPFVTILTHERPTLALHREVAEDPSILAELVSWAYKRSDGQVDDDAVSDKEREARANTAYSVLHHASILPGQNPDGSVDATRQLKWVEETRRLCAERGRDVVGRHVIGQVLGCSPAGGDGIWPCESVRATLDALSDREIGTGFTVRKRNLRGIVSRSLTGGGEQERGIALGYRENAIKLRAEYPFTSSLLQELAASYDHEAKYHDDDSAWIDR